MIREQLGAFIGEIKNNRMPAASIAVNFIFTEEETEKDFYAILEDGKILLVDGTHEEAIAVMKARESTLLALLDMGVDPVKEIIHLIPKKIDKVSLPEIDTDVSLNTETPDGYDIDLFIYIEDQVLFIEESKSKEGEIGVKIKSSALTDLLEGDLNIAMALLTRKIKIRNKRKLFGLLAEFGLKI